MTFRTNVSVKSKLKHPPPGIPRAFDVFCCPGGREFDELSLPRGGAFDHYIGGGELHLTNLDLNVATKAILFPFGCSEVNSTWLITSERSDVMEFTKMRNYQGIMTAIDFEKAFDSLNWNFLLKSLEFFGDRKSVV